LAEVSATAGVVEEVEEVGDVEKAGVAAGDFAVGGEEDECGNGFDGEVLGEFFADVNVHFDNVEGFGLEAEIGGGEGFFLELLAGSAPVGAEDKEDEGLVVGGSGGGGGKGGVEDGLVGGGGGGGVRAGKEKEEESKREKEEGRRKKKESWTAGTDGCRRGGAFGRCGARGRAHSGKREAGAEGGLRITEIEMRIGRKDAA
jgi:hypothetical protein